VEQLLYNRNCQTRVSRAVPQVESSAFNFCERLRREPVSLFWRSPEYLAYSPRALFLVETFAEETPLRLWLFQ
jgi:hypothetical protein